ncbi:MAG: sigma-54 dependent transcriptional regulator [Spirochaetota bacterium]
MDALKILVVDDEEPIRNQIKKFLIRNNYEVHTASIPSEAFTIMDKEKIDIVLLDINLPEMNGIEVLKRIKEGDSHIEVIMITGQGDQESILQSLKYGAFDYFYKPMSLLDIKASIERTNRFILLNEKLKIAEQRFSYLSKDLEKDIGDVIGKSDSIKKVIELALKAAEYNDTNILITGPSGVGKELIARIVHFASSRKDRCFLPVNCSALSPSLIESELFGFIRGAFTGAEDERKGYFEEADGGTLFFDEIGDMAFEMQAKILRALEEKKLRRVGSNREIPIDVRVVSATNRDIKDLLKTGRFRSDLYFRLNTLEIDIPALKDRREDVPLLVEHYVKHYALKFNKRVPEISDTVFNLFYHYDFPGNIRELKNLVERALILYETGPLEARYFPDLSAGFEQQDTPSITGNLNLKKVELLYIREALQRAGNNKTRASELLGITRHALDRKLRKYGLTF